MNNIPATIGTPSNTANNAPMSKLNMMAQMVLDVVFIFDAAVG